MATDAPNTIDRALANLRDKPTDQTDNDTVLATKPAVSYVDLAAKNPANPNNPSYVGPRYSD